MAKSRKQKLYAYVDESGQDSEGIFFVVGIVVTNKNRDRLVGELEAIERESGKNEKKWHRTRPQHREQYTAALATLALLDNSIFIESFTNTKQYIEMSSFATARAILRKAKGDYSASIFVDGFKKKELKKFEQGLKELRIKKGKLRGVRREENNALMRLADAVCGLVRDAENGNDKAEKELKRLIRKGVITAL